MTAVIYLLTCQRLNCGAVEAKKKKKNKADVGWANNPQSELQAGSFQVNHKAKSVLSCSHQGLWHLQGRETVNIQPEWKISLCSPSWSITRCCWQRWMLHKLCFRVKQPFNLTPEEHQAWSHQNFTWLHATKSSWLQQKLPQDERQKRYKKKDPLPCQKKQLPFSRLHPESYMYIKP